jgi:hypothetical protein
MSLCLRSVQKLACPGSRADTIHLAISVERASYGSMMFRPLAVCGETTNLLGDSSPSTYCRPGPKEGTNLTGEVIDASFGFAPNGEEVQQCRGKDRINNDFPAGCTQPD